MLEYDLKYRPRKLTEVVGQPAAVGALTAMLKTKTVSRRMLFTGPPGTGKTTCARIMARRAGADDFNTMEVNAAEDRGIDTAKSISKSCRLSPAGCRSRAFIMDEVHRLTPDAQACLLKVLEEPPDTAYFILCTTDPQKLLKAIVSRCTEVKFAGVPDDEVRSRLAEVAGKEGLSVPASVLDRITEVSENSVRKALVVLQQVGGLGDEEAMLNAVQNSDARRQAIDLARLLIKGASWSEVAAVVRKIDEDPESVRRLVLGYANAVCLGGGKASRTAYSVLECFRDNYFDMGKAGLTRSCYEFCHGG